ncbi:uncharacterized protein BcabD6B2_35190 [Babesia caballi]|uniref:Uncharacterized protein n=1 Tax=Babesia caballi TaxID=5871 RepID=A0AAV4LWC4_BABCB|nr:hypothetical protein BcabD6B2_35190 [Babesia caballi]
MKPVKAKYSETGMCHSVALAQLWALRFGRETNGGIDGNSGGAGRVTFADRAWTIPTPIESMCES